MVVDDNGTVGYVGYTSVDVMYVAVSIRTYVPSGGGGRYYMPLSSTYQTMHTLFVNGRRLRE